MKNILGNKKIMFEIAGILCFGICMLIICWIWQRNFVISTNTSPLAAFSSVNLYMANNEGFSIKSNGTNKDMLPASSSPDNLYEVDNEDFNIKSNGTNARATTDGINEAIMWAKSKGYSGIKLKQGTYLIQCTWDNPFTNPTDGILVPSDTVLNLDKAVLKLETNDQPAYNIIYTLGGSNIVINGGHLIGDKDNHIYSSGDFPTHEWGSGVNVVGSSDVTIQNMKIEGMTGDAVSVRGRRLSNSKNVVVSNSELFNCRRQGISVTGCEGGALKDNVIYNISGTSPEYGIDIEANSGYDARNLTISGNRISNCKGGSILCFNGSDYVVENNTCIQGLILALRPSDVTISGNIMDNSIIGIRKTAINITVANNQLLGNSQIIYE